MTDQQIYEELGKIEGLPTCSNWAMGFADSIRTQIKKGRTLSPKQKEYCFKILEENSPQAQEALATWAEEFEREHKAQAIVLAHYYRRSGYYVQLCTDILDGKVPRQSSYLKMSQNKYAKKILAEMERKPRFEMGEVVVPKKNADIRLREPSEYQTRRLFWGRGGVIVGLDSLIFSSAKGAKRYVVLPFGATETLTVEERHLKRKPKIKEKR